MQSLTHIQIYQNGIKEEGMTELIKSFNSNPNLEYLKLNDIKDRETRTIKRLK